MTKKNTKLPTRGYIDKDHIEYNYRELDRVRQRISLIVLNPRFQEAVLLYRKKWGIPPEGKDVSQMLPPYARYFETPNEKELEDMESILIKYNIPFDYKRAIKHYLEYNDLIRMPIPKSTHINFSHQIVFGGGYIRDLSITITPQTTIEDIRDLWPRVQELQKRMIGYSKNEREKKMNKFYRDRRILQLDNQGIRHTEISKIIRKEYGDLVMYYEIPKIIARLRKKIDTA